MHLKAFLRTIFLLSVLVAVLVLPAFSSAAINEQIPFQGTLKDTGGAAVTDGDYDIVFRLYDAAAAGTTLWTGTHSAANSNAVTVTDGIFRVLLGSGTGNTLSGVDFDSADIYLGITIESDSEMTPRQRLAAAPYAFNADTVDGLDASAFAQLGGTATFTAATSTNLEVTSNFTVSGTLTDGADSVGASGYVLQTTGGGVQWVATSSLGISGSNPFGSSIDESELNISGGPTDGYVLQASSTASGGFVWTATSSLNIAGSNPFGADINATELASEDFGDFTCNGTTCSLDATYLTTVDISANTNLTVGATGVELSNDDIALTAGYNIPLTASTTAWNNLLGTAISTTTGDWLGTLDGQEGTYYLDLGNHTGTLASTSLAAEILVASEINSEAELESLLSGVSNVFTNNDGALNDDDITDDSLESLSDVASFVQSINDILYWNGSSWTVTATTSWDTNTQLSEVNVESFIFDGDNSGTLSSGTLALSSLSFTGTLASTSIEDAYLRNTGDTISGALTLSGSAANIALGSNFLSGDGGDEGIFVDSDGNVGIGTSSPQNTFHVLGKTRLEFETSTTSPWSNQLFLTTPAGGDSDVSRMVLGRGVNGLAAVQSAEDGGTYMGYLSFSTRETIGSLIERMRIDSSGNVGIGTTSPASKLDVWGDFQVGTSSTPTFFTDVSTGNVGIGTSTPTRTLSVDGTFNTTGNVYVGENSSNTNNNVRIYSGDNNTILKLHAADGYLAEGSVLVGSESTSNLILRTDNTDRLTIDTAGNVGIGTTTPSSALTVAGDAFITGSLYDSTNSSGTAGMVLQTTSTGQQWVATSTLGLNGGAGTVTSVDMSVPTGLAISGNPITTSGTLALLYDTGYSAVLTASSTAWNNFLNTPSSVITAGTGLSWSTNTLNAEVQTSDLASFGSDNQIPFTNSGGTDFDYSSNLTFDGTDLGLGATQGIAFDGVRYLYASSTNDSIMFGESAGGLLQANGIRNIAIGRLALATATSSDNNFALGPEALRFTESGFSNTAIGYQALTTNTVGNYNTAIGTYALRYANDGNSNTAIGYAALEDLTSGVTNIAIGRQAARDLILGDDNIFVGYLAADAATSTSNNIFVGREVARFNTNTTGNNTILGYQAGRGASGQSDYDSSVIAGYRAGFDLTTGNNNILFGYQAGDSLTTGANNIIIGYDVEAPSNTADGQLNIGNLIFGTGIDGTGTTLSSGNIGIGTTSPASKLDVWGDFQVGTSSTPTFFTDVSTGNVGIGTSTPTRTLSVDGTFNTTGNVYVGENSSNTNNNVRIYSGDNNTILKLHAADGYLAEGSVLVGSESTSNLILRTDNTDRLTIDTAGNVGIGTTSPASKLDVWGDFQVGTSSRPLFYANTDADIVNIGSTTIAGTGALNIYQTAADRGITLTSADGTETGYIGLTAIGNYLQFTKNDAIRFDVGGNQLTVTNTGVTINEDSDSNANFRVESNNDAAALFVQASSDNIGIGTTSPASKLDVWGDFRVGTSSTPSLFVDVSEGNIGIGTTSLSRELTIAGDIRVGASTGFGCIEDYDGTSLGGGTCTSDARLKENIEPLAGLHDSVIEDLTKLIPVTYNWNEESAELYQKNIQVTNTGLIAQNVEEYFPELILENSDGYKHVKFGNLQFYILEALREMWEVVTGNQDKIETLEERIEALEAKLDIAIPADVEDDEGLGDGGGDEIEDENEGESDDTASSTDDGTEEDDTATITDTIYNETGSTTDDGTEDEEGEEDKVTEEETEEDTTENESTTEETEEETSADDADEEELEVTDE